LGATFVLSQRQLLLLAASAAAVALVLAGLSIGTRRAPQSTATPQSTGSGGVWPDDFVLAPGQHAVGVGQLVARAGEPTRLCTGQDIIEASRGAQYRCSPDSVELRGVDVGSMAGAHLDSGALVVDSAVIRGVWDGQVLAVESVGGESPALPLAPELTCQAEVPGASPEGSQGLETEAAYGRLQSEVLGDPDVYGGEWVSSVAGRQVMMVGTTESVAAAEERLRQVFPFALCVVPVMYPASELERIADALRSPDGTWQPEISVERNRVLVRIPVLDANAVGELARFPGAEALPLLVRDGPN
jgi:hypothetical protein